MTNERDWFRRRTWTDEDRVKFFERLHRSRSDFHKAQYLRLQALELYEADGVRHASPALELLDMLLERWPDATQLASAHEQRADCLRELGRDAEAIIAYKAAFAQQRRLPSVLTNAHYEFAWWVASSGMREHFDEALRVLEEFCFDGDIPFPAHIYLAEGARALILDARDDRQSASIPARRALAAAEKTHSGLRYHATVGLVRVREGAAHARLVAIAGR